MRLVKKKLKGSGQIKSILRSLVLFTLHITLYKRVFRRESAYILSHKVAVDLHLSKALSSLDPDNLQLHCCLGLGTLFCF